VVYYLFGLFLPIIGNRAFQVILLPLGTFLDEHQRHLKVLKVVVLVILVASPVVVANFMTNYTLKGGGNAHDFHGDEAGRFLQEYSNLERDGAIAYHSAGFPTYITKTGEELSVVTVEEVIVSEANSSDTIVYGEWQEYQASRYRHDCNFDPTRRNTVYDNRLQVLKDSTISEPFVCTEVEQ
ncbi:MAG: hypothetical protein R3324_22015, partial [Halobacteriales archaeon]|nr:hypothetical protein [Halobacteriales archaeon]